MRLGPKPEVPTLDNITALAEDRESTDPAYFFDMQPQQDIQGQSTRLQRIWLPDDDYIDEPWLYDDELPGITGTQDSGAVYPPDVHAPDPWR